MSVLSELPLKQKIISIILATTALILVLSGATLLVFDYVNSREELRREVGVIAEIVALRSAAAVSFNDHVNATSNLEALRLHQSIDAACIYSRGKLFVEFIRGKDEFHICRDEQDVTRKQPTPSGHILLSAPISVEDNPIGTLYILVSTAKLTERVLSVALAATTFLALAGFFSLGIASRLISLAITPLTRLTQTARQITDAGDYAVRVERLFRDDVGDLVDAFNTMLETIENQNTALRDSEEKLRAIINDAPDVIEIVDADGRIRFINHNDRLPIGRRDSIPTLYDDLSDSHRCDAENALRLVFETGTTTQFETYDHVQDRWYLNHLGPLREQGKIKSALVLRRDISALKKAHDQLHQIAFYDPLTGLPNRRLFRERLTEELNRCRAHGTKLALLFLDLDNFKRVNDTLGHDAGDRLLISIADRLTSCVRVDDTVSRLGGDEFTVLITGLASNEPAETIAEKILDKLRMPIELGKETIRVTVSIGIAVSPDHGITQTEIMQHADIAMYEAKSVGKNTFQMFDISHLQKGIDLLNFESEIRDALTRDEFQLHYQPQLDLETNRVVGIEALIRWQHPTRGFLRPSTFIDRAEELGMIKPLSKWTLRTACREIQRASKNNPALQHLKLAVNLSARQFKDPELLSFIRTIIDETGFPAHRLEFEITETTLITDVEDSIATMLALKNLGISLSIDDFGTGYASLNYLKRLPVDYLKIDGSFIRDIPRSRDDIAITMAVIAMAHRLDIKVLAEGVQNIEQLEFLKNNGCNYAQGYLIGPPLPIGALEQLIHG